MSNALSPVEAHEMAGQQVIHRGGAHFSDVLDHPSAFFYRELHPLVAFQKADVLERPVSNTRFVADVELPSLFLSVAPGNLPFRKPLAPVLAPLRSGFHLDEYRFWVVLVGAVTKKRCGVWGRSCGLGVAEGGRSYCYPKWAPSQLFMRFCIANISIVAQLTLRAALLSLQIFPYLTAREEDVTRVVHKRLHG